MQRLPLPDRHTSRITCGKLGAFDMEQPQLNFLLFYLSFVRSGTSDYVRTSCKSELFVVSTVAENSKLPCFSGFMYLSRITN